MGSGEIAEEVAGGLGGACGEMFEREVFLGGDELGGFADVGGFAAFTAIGGRGEEWAIGFEHEAIERDSLNGFTNSGGVFERRDAGEADD